MTPKDKHCLIAERIEGIQLKPHRDVAIARVASRLISSTGSVFELRDGRKFPMQDGSVLRKPEGSNDWNDRYFLNLGERLGDEIAPAVDAYRLDPPDYSSDLNLCARAEAKMPKRQYGEYPKFVHQALGIAAPFEHGQTSWELFLMLSASAPTRVDAMVALIRGAGL